MKKIWNVAIYARVSTDKKEQQESIPAQVQSLKKWLLEKRGSDQEAVYELTQVYEDMGVSGSSFDRESFIRMKEDIDIGKINLVLTRDLSRFSRNYITAGYYLEDYFKVNGIRFISVLDNVDTLEEVSDIVPFKNILNEMYIKDCSRRSRDGLKQRMLRGSSIASKAPYGYVFEEEYNGNVKTIRLIPAEDDTVEVVKDIFDLYLGGWGFGKIATYLNSKEIKPPSARLENFALSKFGIWTNNGIKSILNNPKYAGIMAQGRWRKVSYKVNKNKITPPEEWIVGETFKGIVDKKTFDEVQATIEKRRNKYRCKGSTLHIFSTVLICKECGGSMSFRKKYNGYKCTNSQMGGGRCTSHSVKEEQLIELVRERLRQYVDMNNNKQNSYDQINKLEPNNHSYDKQLKKVEGEIEKVDKQFQKLYMDKLDDKVNERNFELLSQAIVKKQKELMNKKEALLSKKQIEDHFEDEYEFYKQEVDRMLKFDEFNRQMVEKLIDKIIISEDKNTKEKGIEIFYKFKSE
jgi:site-specific DNA recombinase